MKIADVMNINIMRIRSGSTMREAAEAVAMSQASDLMVIDDDDCFVGVLSEGDLIRAAMPSFEELLDAGGLAQAFEEFLAQGKTMASKSIDSLVIKDPITVKPDDEVVKAAGTMVSKQIRRLPVIQDGRLLGIVSRSDICRAVLKD